MAAEELSDRILPKLSELLPSANMMFWPITVRSVKPFLIFIAIGL